MWSTTSSNHASGHQVPRNSRPPKKPKLSEEAWSTAVASFRSVVDNENSDENAIRQAWTVLRQKYGDRFNARVSPQPTAQQKLQPFALWAVDHLDGDVLQRVLNVVFARELARCEHLTLLKSTASRANTTMWHLLLYFGATVLSNRLLGYIRKRVHAFDTDPDNGTWAFTDAYTRVLQAAARRLKMNLDSTAIPCPQTERVFTRPDLTALASANPEFDQPASRKAVAPRGSPMIKIEEATTNTTAINTTKEAPRISDYFQRREEVMSRGAAAHDVPPPSIEPDIPRKARNPSARDAAGSPGGSSSKNKYIPSNPPENQGPPDTSDEIRRNPRRKARAGQGTMTLMLEPKGEDTEDVNAMSEFLPPARRGQTVDMEQQPRELSTIYVQTREPQWAPPKRPTEEIRETYAGHDDRAKRVKVSASRSDLLDQNMDWDDNTILCILKQLAATCPREWTVINGMGADPTSPPVQLKGGEGEKGSLLVPLKLEDGQRLLVVVDLQPHFRSKGGIIRYYDPMKSHDENAAGKCQAMAVLTPLLSRVLPGRGLPQADWETGHCIFPELVSEEDGGLAVCLAAMYEVGARSLPEYLDWGFWRYLVLGGFFPDDQAVQSRVRHYRDGIVSKLIRQGRMSDGFLSHRGSGSEETEHPGTAATNPLDRIEAREENSGKILAAIHEGYKIFQTLQEHLDMGKGTFKARVDKYAYIQKDLRRKLNVGPFEVLTEVQRDEQTEAASNRKTLRQAMKEHALCRGYLKGLDAAGDCIYKALNSLTVWRRMVNEAVMEKDESLLIRSIE